MQRFPSLLATVWAKLWLNSLLHHLGAKPLCRQLDIVFDCSQQSKGLSSVLHGIVRRPSSGHCTISLALAPYCCTQGSLQVSEHMARLSVSAALARTWMRAGFTLPPHAKHQGLSYDSKIHRIKDWRRALKYTKEDVFIKASTAFESDPCAPSLGHNTKPHKLQNP